MFEQLEIKYKENSVYRNNRFILVLLGFVIIILAFLSFVFDWNAWIILSITIISFLLFIYLQCISEIIFRKKLNVKNWYLVFNIFACLRLFNEIEKEVDMKFLVNTLDSFNVDDKDKLKVLIEHYNNLIYEDYFSIKGLFSIIISILFPLSTIMMDDSAYDFYESNTFGILMLLFLALITYILSQFFFNIFDRYFSKKRLYRIIEESLNEFYINFEDYRRKYIMNVVVLLDEDTISLKVDKHLNKILHSIGLKNIIYFDKNSDFYGKVSLKTSHIFIIKHRQDKVKKIQLITKLKDNNQLTSSYLSEKCKKSLSRMKNISYASVIDKKYIQKMFIWCLKHTLNTVILNIPTDNDKRMYDEVGDIINTLLDIANY